jgi:hypothetical protein
MGRDMLRKKKIAIIGSRLSNVIASISDKTREIGSSSSSKERK